MLYRNWKVFYRKIIDDFNFEIKKDMESARLLENIILSKKLLPENKLEDLIRGNNVAIFGAGPSIKNTSIKNYKNFIKIAADGVTTYFIEKKIIPDIIITDLDGKINDQIRANKKGSIVIIHSHGDNIQKIKSYVSNFSGYIMGTTQTDPSNFENLHNFGGFTDGDRCVFLADHFKAKKINLVGFDYNSGIGKYSFSKHKNKENKLKKLRWCKYLIDQLKRENPSIKYI